jgi:hypothetical protein
LAIKRWEHIHTGFEADGFRIDGVAVWEHTWRNTGGRESVIDSNHRLEYVFNVYEVTVGQTTVVFAAGELSNGVWGFFKEVE